MKIQVPPIAHKIENVSSFTFPTNLRHLLQVNYVAFKQVSGRKYFVKQNPPVGLLCFLLCLE